MELLLLYRSHESLRRIIKAPPRSERTNMLVNPLKTPCSDLQPSAIVRVAGCEHC
jgi:hypothetical protein